MNVSGSQAGRRILMVSMGACGNEIANAFVDSLLTECGVGPKGEAPADKALADALTVFCDRTADGRLVPRRIIAATTESGVDFPHSRFGSLYPPEAKILDDEEFAASNWGRGYRAPTVDTLLDIVRERIARLNDNCVIWLFHSLGGGYGSGAGSRFLESMREEYPGVVPVVSIAVAPSFTVSDTVVQPYNAVLALKRVLTCTDQVLLFDNEVVRTEASRRVLPPKVPQYSDLNELIGTALYTLVSPLLWPDADGRRTTAEALHAGLWSAPPGASWEWASAGAPPMSASERLVAISMYYDATSPGESETGLAGRLLDERARLLSSPFSGQWLKMLTVRLGAKTVPGGYTQLAFNNRSDQRRVIAAGGHTALAGLLERIAQDYQGMYRRKAFLHWYLQEGIDEMDWTLVQQTYNDAIEEIKRAGMPEDAEE